MIQYRCEEVFGSHITNIINVITYEVMILGNNDILIYLNNDYLENSLKKETISFINELIMLKEIIQNIVLVEI